MSLTLVACSTYQPSGTPGEWRDASGKVVDPNIPQAAVSAAGPSAAAIEPYRIQIADSLDILVEHSESVARPNTQVGPDGKIALPLIGVVEVAGHTLADIRMTVAKRYNEFLVDAKVSVSLRTYRKRSCAVLGQVQKPGLHPVEGTVTLMDVVATAGGFTTPPSGTAGTTADLSQAFVARAGSFVPVDFDALFKRGQLSQNITLLPGDLVYVPSVFEREVIVLGSVRASGVVPMSRPLTVLAAIARAGGFTDLGKLTNVAVVRNITSRPIVRIVDIESALSGLSTDFLLEDGDVLFVPRDDLRALDLPGLMKSASLLTAGILVANSAG